MNRSAGRDPFDLASDNRSQMITTFGGADNARSEPARDGVGTSSIIIARPTVFAGKPAPTGFTTASLRGAFSCFALALVGFSKAGSGPYPGPLPEGEGTDGSEHAIAVKDLEHPHRDPFDRLIVATAMTEPMKRLTADLWELACQRWRWIRHT